MFNPEKPDPLDKGKALFRKIREGLEKEDYKGLLDDAERMTLGMKSDNSEQDKIETEEDEVDTFVKNLRPIEKNEEAMRYKESRPDLY